MAKRDYKLEYEKFQSSEKAKKDRAARNKARRQWIEAWRVKKWDWKDLHHFKWIAINQTRVVSASTNRWVAEKSRLKGSKRDKKNRGK